MPSKRIVHRLQSARTRRRRACARLLLAAASFAWLVCADASAGNHVSKTWLPAEKAMLRPGVNKVTFKLPTDRHGAVPHSLCLITAVTEATSQPMPVEGEPPPAAARDPDAPVVLKPKCNGKPLPPWTITKKLSVYFIGLSSIRANPGFKEATLELDYELQSIGPVFLMAVVGAPDAAVLAPDFDGPMADLIARDADGEQGRYFRGLEHQLLGRLDDARKIMEPLADARDAWIGRYARRNLRTIRYQQRPRPAPDDLVTRRSTMAWLHQNGLFPYARAEGSFVGAMEPANADMRYRHSEVGERLGFGIGSASQFAEQAGFAEQIGDPSEWSVLFVVLGKENGVELSREHVQGLYLNWNAVERLVFGSSHGTLRMRTDYVWLEDDSAQKYVTHPGGVFGPADDLFSPRGAYDSVISVRPDGRDQSIGADCGPNGAGLTDLNANSNWEVMLREWSRQFAWAVDVSESGLSPQTPREAAACGMRPSPSDGFGHRTALRYYATAAMCRKTLIAAPAAERGSLRRWRIEGPYATPAAEAPAASAADARPPRHVADAFPPAGATPKPPREIESDSDFVDLKQLLGASSGLARASCWVYSPGDQLVSVWLGFNDGMAVRINGESVRRGNYYMANKWEDRNLTDTVASFAFLRQGWNRIEALIEGRPAPRDGGWGYSMRLCDWNNQPLVGLATRVTDPPPDEQAPTFSAPVAGPHYDWNNVRADYNESLPRLDDAALQRITGVAGLSIRAKLGTEDGFVAIGAADGAAGPRRRELPAEWNAAQDSDWELNNLLDWAREDCAAWAYEKGGRQRALLLLRMEAVEAYLDLLLERTGGDRAAAEQDARPSQRILGYVLVSGPDTPRPLLVVDAFLGEPASWPIDEEDLLRLPMPPQKADGSAAGAGPTEPAKAAPAGPGTDR